MAHTAYIQWCWIQIFFCKENMKESYQSHCFMMPCCCAYESKVLEKTLKGAEWRTAEKSKPVSYVIELTHNSNNDNTHTMGLQWSGYRNPAFLSSQECFFFFSDTDDRGKSYIMALQIVLQYLCITISSLSLETCRGSSDSDRCVTLWLHLSMLLVLWLDEHKCRLWSRIIFW